MAAAAQTNDEKLTGAGFAWPAGFMDQLVAQRIGKVEYFKNLGTFTSIVVSGELNLAMTAGIRAGVVGFGGNFTPRSLKEFNDWLKSQAGIDALSLVRTHEKARLKNDYGINSDQQMLLSVASVMEARYASASKRVEDQCDAEIEALSRSLAVAKKRKADMMEETKAEFEPVSRFPEVDMLALHNECFELAVSRAAGEVPPRVLAATQANIDAAIVAHSQEVLRAHKAAYLSVPVTKNNLLEWSRRHIASVRAEGGSIGRSFSDTAAILGGIAVGQVAAPAADAAAVDGGDGAADQELQADPIVPPVEPAPHQAARRGSGRSRGVRGRGSQ